MSGKEEIMSTMEKFEMLQEKYLPKVDRKLVIDLFLRMREEPGVRPMYTIETFVEEGGNGRNQAGSDADDRHGPADAEHPKVIEVTGTYTGSDVSIGASHEPSTAASRRESQSRNY